jgi:hypothetical protein
VDRLKQGVITTYNRIPNHTQVEYPNTTQNIDHIVQTIDKYQQEIENLKEKLIPTTPLVVK